MKRSGLLVCLGAMIWGTALAGPADYVYAPTVESGEREIDFKYGSARKSDDPRAQAASIGFGYGVNDWWFTEAYLKYAKEGGDGVFFDAFEWENKFQLTETGKYLVDIGLITEIEITHQDGDPYEFKIGPLFQTEFGKLQLNANLLFERKWHGDAAHADELHKTEIGYQWQAKYRWHPEFEFGAQGFGQMGKWNDWAPHDEQNHRVGPAIFGKIALGGRQKLQYNAAWLFGVTQGAPDHTLRMQMEYEF